LRVAIDVGRHIEDCVVCFRKSDLNGKVLSLVNIRTEDRYTAVGVSSTHQEGNNKVMHRERRIHKGRKKSMEARSNKCRLDGDWSLDLAVLNRSKGGGRITSLV
jgi:hypothetical protein